jgi:hypothetical protein
MKHFKKYITGSAALITGCALLVSCEKTFDNKMATTDDLSNSAVVQVFIATVNAASNHVYIDGKVVTGAALASGSIFPATITTTPAGPVGIAVPAGLHAFEVRSTAAGTTQIPLNFAENMQVARHYTVFMYDTITTPKQKTVTDDISAPPADMVKIRLANFIYNPTAVPGIDVFSFSKNANIFTNVPVTEVTNFINYPALGVTSIADTLYIRETGSSTNIVKLTIAGGTAPTMVKGRSYTLVYRGSHRGTRSGTLYPTY